MIRVRFYGRVSTNDQVSTKAQLDDMRANYPKEDRVIDKAIEENRSAKDKDNVFDPIKYMQLRPKFYEECYLPATRKEYDELGIWKWDRFARSDFAPIIFRMFDYHGVKVIALRDSNEPIVRDIQGALSKEEIRKIKERVELRHQELIREGKIITRLPFGYKPIKRLVKDKLKVVKWVINEKEAAIVRKIHSMKDRPIKEIANEVDMPYSTIKDILNNKTYFGILTFRDIEYKSKDFQAILNQDS